MLKIMEPTAEILPELLNGIMELKANPTPFDIHASQKLIEYSEKNFDGYLDYLNTCKNGPIPQDRVPATVLLLFDGKCFVGLYHVRHYLNEGLKKSGGHIAYQILPSCRKRGYAKQGLKLVLDYCKNNLHLENVMLSCDENNPTSHSVMLSVMREMGGYTRPDTVVDGHIEHHVWIKTDKREKGEIRPLAIAVIRKGNTVLAVKGYDSVKNQYFYRLPGGGIHFGETAENAVKRELKEETGLDIQITKALPIAENIFTFEGGKGHEIVFPFECTLSETDKAKDAIQMIEPEMEGFEMKYVDIDNPIPIYPEYVLK
ncbi:MAG: GNAT family N-acetyltransferase [Alphaproteobacteria bacterium]|nr:GNAT family N-acetyltransferase [Alphaproteobacteria bacterium]